MVVKNAQGARADRSSCGSTECAQASGSGGVAAALKEVSSGSGVAARVRDVAPLQLSHGEINKHENASATGGGRQLVERCDQHGPGGGMVSSLEAGVARRSSQVSVAIVNEKMRCVPG